MKELIPSDLCIIMNMENQDSLPRNFRMTEEPYIPQKNSQNFPVASYTSTHGLPELRASASGQFSQKSLMKIIETIPAHKILIIDLREESHGFVNGMAVSWYSDKNWSNKNLSLEEILADERQRLQKTLKDQYIHVYLKKTNLTDPLIVHVNEVCSEADLAQALDMQYARIPGTDHMKPADHDIDLFVEIIKTQLLNEKNPSWVHMHCNAGRGRSTTFISMYDMMRNATHVSFQDILARQAMIGGKDLFEPVDVSDWKYSLNMERLLFLAEFYNYCLENPNFGQSWSFWKSHK